MLETFGGHDLQGRSSEALIVKTVEEQNSCKDSTLYTTVQIFITRTS